MNRRLWRYRGWIVSIALVTAAVACVGVLAVYSMSRAAPPWWRTVASDESAAHRGDVLEQAVNAHLHRVDRSADAGYVETHPGRWRSEPWSVGVPVRDANAWLKTRLPAWLEQGDLTADWPDAVQELQLDFSEGVVRVGVRLEAGARSQVFSATLEPEVREDGALWTRATWVHVGRVPIPADWVLGQAEEKLGDLIPLEWRERPETGLLFEVFEGQRPLAQDAAVVLGDRRTVRLLSIRPEADRLVITCRTEWE